MDSDVRIVDVQVYFRNEQARSPIKFGNVVMDSAVLCEAQVVVENRRGETGTGWGGMFLADFWAFPSDKVPHAVREEAMSELSRRMAAIMSGYRHYGHPIDIVRELEPAFDAEASRLSTEQGLAEPMPRLATLVSMSPLDAALHDAFGLANGIDTYDGYGPDFMNHDLGYYFGPDYQGLYPKQFLRSSYASHVPIFHLVGGLDMLTKAEAGQAHPEDQLPDSLDSWIEKEGIYCFKVKLRGNDLGWDIERTIAVDQVAKEALAQLGRDSHYLSADTNEMCESPEYLVEMLAKIEERAPEILERFLYVEQPTERDLARSRHDMRKLARIVPVLADESLYDDEQFELALELGWSGLALKACKGQSHTILWLAKAAHLGLPYSIQDLTNPGLALLQSVGIAARSYPMKGVEYNSRQYFPGVSPDIQAAHPDVFRVTGGEVSTASLKGGGLGFAMDKIRP